MSLDKDPHAQVTVPIIPLMNFQEILDVKSFSRKHAQEEMHKSP